MRRAHATPVFEYNRTPLNVALNLLVNAAASLKRCECENHRIEYNRRLAEYRRAKEADDRWSLRQ